MPTTSKLLTFLEFCELINKFCRLQQSIFHSSDLQHYPFEEPGREWHGNGESGNTKVNG